MADLDESLPKKQIYLHIGIPKTGSTSIQDGLHMNRVWLEEQGYYIAPYKYSAEKPQVVHSKIPREFKRNLKNKPATKEMLESIKTQPADYVIITSEFFSFLKLERIQQLGEILLESFNVVVIVYIRDQVKGIQSTWTQGIKRAAQLLSFEQALPKLYNRRPMYFYHDFLSDWETVFGKENLRVRIFDEVIRERDLFIDFLLACDLKNFDGLVLPPKQNVTPSANYLALVQAISDRLSDSYTLDKQYHRPRHKLFYLLQNSVADEEWNQSKFNGLTREINDIIQEKYAEQNALVARRYFDREQLFVDEFKESPVTPLDIDELSKEDLLGVLAHLGEIFIHEKIK